nr:MAG TPA: hypothetical protein [Caudoviricetes sp.]
MQSSRVSQKMSCWLKCNARGTPLRRYSPNLVAILENHKDKLSSQPIPFCSRC